MSRGFAAAASHVRRQNARTRASGKNRSNSPESRQAGHSFIAWSNFAQARRHGWRFGVAFFDLDGFKHVNDRWGHACGDDLLRQVGQALGSSVRDIDTVARVGGDEFLLLLAPPLELEPAQRVVERVREAVGSITSVCGHSVTVSASVGLAFYPDHGATLEALMACAEPP